MSFSAVVTPDDLKRGELVEPGWYPMLIEKYEEKEANTDKSVNAIFHLKVFDGSEKGKTARYQLNEKAMGFGKNLYAALKFPFDKEKGYSVNSDLFNRTVGEKLMVYIKRGTSNKGNSFNEVADFKPLS